MIGLKKGIVKVENYTNSWKEEYQKEEKQLKNIFKEEAVTIEHVGSTSIEGLSAKPIIDIAIGVNNLRNYKHYQELVKDKEEYSVKEDSQEDEILLRKGPEDNRTHFIHIMEIKGQRYKETIIFRDYLRKYPDKMKEYQTIKEDLAVKFPTDRTSYINGKSAFIKQIITEAEKEFK